MAVGIGGLEHPLLLALPFGELYLSTSLCISFSRIPPTQLAWYVPFYTHVIHPTSPRYHSILAGVAINFVGRAKQGKKPFTKEITVDYCKYRAGEISITQSFILHGIIVFLAFTFFLVISCWLILRDNTVPDGTKYQPERIESGI